VITPGPSDLVHNKSTKYGEKAVIRKKKTSSLPQHSRNRPSSIQLSLILFLMVPTARPPKEGDLAVVQFRPRDRWSCSCVKFFYFSPSKTTRGSVCALVISRCSFKLHGQTFTPLFTTPPQDIHTINTHCISPLTRISLSTTTSYSTDPVFVLMPHTLCTSNCVLFTNPPYLLLSFFLPVLLRNACPLAIFCFPCV